MTQCASRLTLAWLRQIFLAEGSRMRAAML